MICLPLCTVKP
ncbi:hypothetical protein BMF94_1057, partial [Rhodotorula taiwanensis]